MEITPSNWCRQKYDEAIEADDMESASHYQEMFELWLKRGM